MRFVPLRVYSVVVFAVLIPAWAVVMGVSVAVLTAFGVGRQTAAVAGSGLFFLIFFAVGGTAIYRSWSSDSPPEHSVAEFVRHGLEPGRTAGHTTVRTAYGRYLSWCDDRSKQPVERAAFVTQLRENDEDFGYTPDLGPDRADPPTPGFEQLAFSNEVPVERYPEADPEWTARDRREDTQPVEVQADTRTEDGWLHVRDPFDHLRSVNALFGVGGLAATWLAISELLLPVSVPGAGTVIRAVVAVGLVLVFATARLAAERSGPQFLDRPEAYAISDHPVRTVLMTAGNVPLMLVSLGLFVVVLKASIDLTAGLPVSGDVRLLVRGVLSTVVSLFGSYVLGEPPAADR